MADSTANKLARELKTRIERGDYKPGERLLSLRSAMVVHGCSKNAVISAYEQLVAGGLVEPRRGMGFFVRGEPYIDDGGERWAPALSQALREHQLHVIQGAPPWSSWAEGLPPSRWLESCRLDRYMQKIGRLGLGLAFRYGDPMGYLPLRRHLSQRMASVGFDVDPSHIILTHGASQAVDIIIRCYVRAGDAVLVDSPGFYPTIKKIELQGATAVGVPRTPHGPDTDRLRQLAHRTRARLFITQSLSQNPTGSDISPGVAADLLKVAAKTSLLVVDQDILGDYKPAAEPRLGVLDGLANTIHVGSFSKTISSLVRVGFIACNPERARSLLDVKTILAVNSSQYSERAVDAIVTEGRFARHLVELQHHARQATANALRILDDLGAEVFCRPRETLYLWARFPGISDSVAWARELMGQGICLMPGAIFYPKRVRSAWVRCNVGFMRSDDETTKAIALWSR